MRCYLIVATAGLVFLSTLPSHGDDVVWRICGKKSQAYDTSAQCEAERERLRDRATAWCAGKLTGDEQNDRDNLCLARDQAATMCADASVSADTRRLACLARDRARAGCEEDTTIDESDRLSACRLRDRVQSCHCEPERVR